MKLRISAFFLPRALRAAVLAGLALALAGCESPLNAARVDRFAHTPVELPRVQPKAFALALVAAADGRALSDDSLKKANALLGSQGRLQAQTLSITPFTARGEQLAPRLAAALVRSGAVAPTVLPRPALPAQAERLESAVANGWDLELQSEALVVDNPPCRIARADDWMLHPYRGIGSLGCANRANVARMAADPRDLARPRTLDGADGRAAVEAVERYQSGNTRDLLDIDFDQ